MLFSSDAFDNFVFTDLETTGLDPDRDRIVELAYGVGLEGPIETLYFGVQEVPPFIDDLIGFTARDLKNKPSATSEDIATFLKTCKDRHILAANPAFDYDFLYRNGLWNFKYRKADIESYAMKAFKINYLPSMQDIFEILTVHGYAIPAPNHTAAGDVRAMRVMFEILSEEY
jgi:DNA polymerase III epsilon subunit-like protein